jgi:hypothetical protein
MSGTQSMLKSRCDGYAGLIAALDPIRERVRAIAERRLLFSALHAVASLMEPQRNDSPVRHIRCMMIASLRATAIFALLIPMRWARRIPQAFSVLQRCARVSNTPAAAYSTRW